MYPKIKCYRCILIFVIEFFMHWFGDPIMDISCKQRVTSVNLYIFCVHMNFNRTHKSISINLTFYGFNSARPQNKFFTNFLLGWKAIFLSFRLMILLRLSLSLPILRFLCIFATYPQTQNKVFVALMWFIIKNLKLVSRLQMTDFKNIFF